MALSLILISGPDAETFLQGQLTCDIKQVSEQLYYGAYCNHQGRVVATFKITRHSGTYQLTLPSNMLETTLNTLKKFAVFSKVTIDSATADDGQNWRVTDIKSGFANIYPATSERFTPHMLNLPALNAVSFNKGCFLGQEIVARSEHLGKVKRHLHTVKLNGDVTPQPGENITNDKQEIVGTIIDAAGNDQEQLALAVIHDSASKQPCFWQQRLITLHRL